MKRAGFRALVILVGAILGMTLSGCVAYEGGYPGYYAPPPAYTYAVPYYATPYYGYPHEHFGGGYHGGGHGGYGHGGYGGHGGHGHH